MNECLYCKKPVKNKFCNFSCQNRHQNSQRANKRYGYISEFEKVCQGCNKKFVVKEREKLHPQKSVYFCSRSCANRRIHSEETKNKIRQTLTKPRIPKPIKPKKMVELTCKECNNKFIVEFKDRNRVVCSRKCSATIAGKQSVIKQSRRSKNEAYFAELCKLKFDKVLTNEQIFNGWDADVILPTQKIAVLWNGIWHYKQIQKNNSLEQIQNRDKIKLQEIKSCGYTPYIIKDMGGYDKKFVENKFEEFIKLVAAHDSNVNFWL